MQPPPESESAAQPSAGPQRGRTKRPLWQRILRDLLLFALLYLGVRAYQSRDALSGQAPAVVLTALDGRTFDLGGPRERPLLVYFWASWCGVCKTVDPNVAALSGEHAVVTIASLSGDAAKVGANVADRGLTFPVVPDPGAQLAHRFSVRAFPTAIVLKPNGEVSSVETGYTSELGLRARLWWAGR